MIASFLNHLVLELFWGIWKLEEISFFRIAFVMHQAEARDLSAKMEASLASGHCAQLE